MNPIFYIDLYKNGHRDQYPKDTKQVWSNWTPRTSRVFGVKDVVSLGQRYLIAKYFVEEFNKNFFGVSKKEVVQEFKEVIGDALNKTNVDATHIEALHDLGYLPIKIYSIPEGFSTPLGIPSIVITNTKEEFFWLPNYFETLISLVLWKPSTSATTARIYRRICEKWATASGEIDLSPIEYMCHNFSMRGGSGLEDTMLIDMGHLTCFSGTDTLPGILNLRKYYDAEPSVGGSVNATEHSVMCAGEEDGEFETFKRLLTEVYPEGVLSIVSDTWDLWQVLTDYVPRLKNEIINRKGGPFVVRPDSGDPVKIVCGDPDYLDVTKHNYGTLLHPAYYGVLALLAAKLGTTLRPGMLPMINNGRCIYGDSITPERCEQILQRTVEELNLSPFNQILGIGSFTYEWVTRDTYGHAMKATGINRNGKIIPIFKKPITVNGGKFSCKGIPIVYQYQDSDPMNPKYYLTESVDPYKLDDCAYEKIFEDGVHLVKPTWDVIRKRVRSWKP